MKESMGGAFRSVRHWEGLIHQCKWAAGGTIKIKRQKTASFGQIPTNSNKTRVLPLYLSNAWSIQPLYGYGRTLGCKVQGSIHYEIVRIEIGDERSGGSCGVLTLLRPQRCLCMSMDAVACICDVLGVNCVLLCVKKGCQRLLSVEIIWGTYNNHGTDKQQ